MTAKPPLPQRLTREQYYELGRQDFFDGKRVELIRGEVVELSPINIAHARGVGLVHDALRLVLAVGSCNNPYGFRAPRLGRNRSRTCNAPGRWAQRRRAGGKRPMEGFHRIGGLEVRFRDLANRLNWLIIQDFRVQ